MKKNVLSIAFLLVILITPMVLFLKPSAGLLIDEKRQATPFPTKIGTFSQRSVKNYFREIDHFVSDNFPARQVFIVANRNLALAFNDDVDAAKALTGKDGWLFLGNNYNHTIDKFSGAEKLTPSAALNRAHSLEAYFNIFAKHGVKTIFLVGPDKQSIYPEYLPTIIKQAPQRYIEKILTPMRNDGVVIYDPTQDLINYKQNGILYYRTDTHWNLKAGELVANNLLKQWRLSSPPAYRLVEAKAHYGDLVAIANLSSYPLVHDDNYHIHYSTPLSRLQLIEEDGDKSAFDVGSIATTDNYMIINPDASNKASLWIVGDSFTGSLQPFLVGAFSDIKMMHIQKNNPEAIAQKLANAKDKPQYALIVLVERGF